MTALEAPPRTGTGQPTPIRRAPANVKLPCERCIHIDVCAIRDALLEAPIELRVPEPPERARDALTITAAIDVDCSFFRRSSPGSGRRKAGG